MDPPHQIKDLLSDCCGVTCSAGTAASLLPHIFSLSLCIYAVAAGAAQEFHIRMNNRIPLIFTEYFLTMEYLSDLNLRCCDLD